MFLCFISNLIHFSFVFQGHQIKSDTIDGVIKATAEKTINETDHCVVNSQVNSSSRIIGIQGDSKVFLDQNRFEPVETYDSLEPVKPPRLKKMAKLQKLEQGKIGKFNYEIIDLLMRHEMVSRTLFSRILNSLLTSLICYFYFRETF